jgi:hypothetical protein
VAQAAQATVLTGRSQQAKTYSVGKPNAFQLADLDGNAGPEVLFTNVNVIAGAAQPAQATILSARAQSTRTYNVGTPNAFQIADLDGNTGGEVLFTNLSAIAGVGQSAKATVLNSRTQQAITYDVGRPNAMQLADLDGSWAWRTFTNVNVVAGVPQIARDNPQFPAAEVRTYESGRPNALSWPVDGNAGSDPLHQFERRAGVGQPALARFAFPAGQHVRVGLNAYQLADLDGGRREYCSRCKCCGRSYRSLERPFYPRTLQCGRSVSSAMHSSHRPRW